MMFDVCKMYGIGILMLFTYQTSAQSASEDSLTICLDVSLDRQLRFSPCLFTAELGNVEAQFQLGKLYEWQRETNEALKWCRMAAENGLVEAQHYLGDWYYPDSVEPNDPEEAFKWYKLAANNGDAGAQFNLGEIHSGWDQGYHSTSQLRVLLDLVPIDEEQAMFWILKSANQGYFAALAKLGDMYFHGDGVDQNFSEAFSWYRKADASMESPHVQLLKLVKCMTEDSECVRTILKL